MRKAALCPAQERTYKVRDLIKWIVGNMHDKELTQEDVAKELNISQEALSTRLNPKTYENNKKADPFKYGDLLILCKIFDATKEEKEQLLTL